jgi:hypothetical protein
MYLCVSDSPKTYNYLYDVFIAKIKTKNGKIFEKYVVARYSGVVAMNEENDPVRYSLRENIGKIIEAGNPNTSSAFNNEYVGYISGFLSIDDLVSYMKSYHDVSTKIIEE